MEILEIRSFGGDAAPKLTNERTIKGYATVFGQESKYMYDPVLRKCFIEVIEPGAITEEMLRSCDVKALVEHNIERMIARSKPEGGSLSLMVDKYGMSYSFEAPHTPDGDYSVEMVKRGDLFGSSFGYRTDEKKNVTWSKRSDGILLRKVHKIDYIGDISIVANPAYMGTDVNVRSLYDSFEKPDESYKNEVNELRNLLKH